MAGRDRSSRRVEPSFDDRSRSSRDDDFRLDDEERIAAMYEGRYISVNPFTVTLHEDLETLHQKAREYFEAHPHPALTHYRAQVQPLKDGSARAQWACTLLYTIKDFEQEDFTYRAAVDTLLHAIENLTMKKSFLVVVRDFHQFWQDAR